MIDRWMDASGALGQTVIECAVGDTVEICHSNKFNGVVGAISVENGGVLESVRLVNGFRVSNSEIGSLAESDKWNCVDYTHERPGKQIIEFIEDVSRRRSYIEVNGSIRIHDHASIPQGGPAYATYYSEE